MRSSVSVVFFLAMVPLGLMATKLQTAGHRTSNSPGVAAGEAQHRRLQGGVDCVKRPWECDDSPDPPGVPLSANYDSPVAPMATPEPTPIPEVPPPPPVPSTTPPVPSPTPEPPSTAPTGTPTDIVPSLTPGPPSTTPTDTPMDMVPPPTPEPSMTPTDTPTDMEVLLDLHNEARCVHNADPLTYSDDVATSAMAHAQVLSSSCGDLYHSESEDRNGYGENLYLCWGTGATSCYTPEAAMASLYESEVQVDTVAQYGGHATQILWKSTTDMGCAVTTCDLDSSFYAYLVCQYNPAGNVLANLEEEVELPSRDFC